MSWRFLSLREQDMMRLTGRHSGADPLGEEILQMWKCTEGDGPSLLRDWNQGQHDAPLRVATGTGSAGKALSWAGACGVWFHVLRGAPWQGAKRGGEHQVARQGLCEQTLHRAMWYSPGAQRTAHGRPAGIAGRENISRFV